MGIWDGMAERQSSKMITSYLHGAIMNLKNIDRGQLQETNNSTEIYNVGFLNLDL